VCVCVSVSLRLLSCRESEESIDAEIWGSVSKTITTFSPDTLTELHSHTDISLHIKHAHIHSRENDPQPSLTLQEKCSISDRKTYQLKSGSPFTISLSVMQG